MLTLRNYSTIRAIPKTRSKDSLLHDDTESNNSLPSPQSGLLKRLQLSFGLSGNFLTWLASFLDGCALCMVHGSSRSQWVPTPHDLPQGSVLAPLYIIYASELGPLLTDCALLGQLTQLYADDVQTYTCTVW